MLLLLENAILLLVHACSRYLVLKCSLAVNQTIIDLVLSIHVKLPGGRLVNMYPLKKDFIYRNTPNIFESFNLCMVHPVQQSAILRWHDFDLIPAYT